MGTKTRKLRAGDATKAVAYLRCSTDRQEESPGVQAAAIVAWAAAHGIAIVAEHADVGVSGATEGDARAGLVAALASVREHGAGLVLCQRRDRIARDVAEAAVIDRAVGRLGARVVAVDSGDAGDGLGALVLARTMDLIAEVERRLISERTRGALQAKRARGERVGQVPLGYRARGGKLVAHPQEQEALEAARRMRTVKGWPWRRIAATLEREHPRPAGRRWHARSLSGALREAA